MSVTRYVNTQKNDWIFIIVDKMYLLFCFTWWKSAFKWKLRVQLYIAWQTEKFSWKCGLTAINFTQNDRRTIKLLICVKKSEVTFVSLKMRTIEIVENLVNKSDKFIVGQTVHYEKSGSVSTRTILERPITMISAWVICPYCSLL